MSTSTSASSCCEGAFGAGRCVARASEVPDATEGCLKKEVSVRWEFEEEGLDLVVNFANLEVVVEEIDEEENRRIPPSPSWSPPTPSSLPDPLPPTPSSLPDPLPPTPSSLPGPLSPTLSSLPGPLPSTPSSLPGPLLPRRPSYYFPCPRAPHSPANFLPHHLSTPHPHPPPSLLPPSSQKSSIVSAASLNTPPCTLRIATAARGPLQYASGHAAAQY
ncbi:hypothetical protein BC937DRAFT_89212 [Endogone sp. FLAS-F59071]|nr:hypothetical protein BC937DRAFT_89212 [Endogone sp. FLAS-F59071]|eukprot:RUS18023.1 hypothetical protein BC937DRAFT_89212 [Endogone sp. FLAS-F59071]